MSQIRVLSSTALQRTAAMPRGGMLALHLLFLLIAFLLLPSFAQAREVNCATDRGQLAQYMCQLERDHPGIKLYFEYGGSGMNYSTSNLSSEGTATELSASLTKIVTTFQVLEMLSYNDGQNFDRSQAYVRNGWSLETKVRIVPDINAIPAEYARGPGYIYMGPGFASSTCMENGGWRGIEHIAQLSMYTPQNNYEYSIRQLLTMAMAQSFNDAAVLLGAIVAANLAANPNNPNVVTDAQKVILGVTSPNVNGTEHMRWITAFRAVQTGTARWLGASNRTNICNPPGWAGTASAGCNAVSTPADWVMMTRQAYTRTVNRLSPNRYERFFSPTSVAPYMTRARGDNGQCYNSNAHAGNTGTRLLGGTGSAGWGVGPIKVLKTGTIPPPYNMIALAQPDPVGGTQCESEMMVAVVMGLRAANATTRPAILGNMFDKGRAEFTNGACGLAYNGAQAERIASMAIKSNMTAAEQSVARTFVGPDTAAIDVGVQVLPEPSEPGADGGGGGGQIGEPGANVGSSANEEQCANEISLAEQWAQQIKTVTRLGMLDNMFDSAVDEIFSAQCLGKLITMMQQIMATVNTITSMATSGDMMAAIVNAAASAIIRAILDQVFQSLTNMICNVTSEIIDTIDNVSRNLMCFKSPLFSIGQGDPFRIPVNIEDISCSGIAINPLYFSNDPNQPLAYGSIGGVSLDNVMAGDRPYFCGAGFKTVRQDAEPGWRCERDPNYRAPGYNRVRARTCNYLGAFGMIREGDDRCMCQNAQTEWVPCASLYTPNANAQSRTPQPTCPSGYFLDGTTCVSIDENRADGQGLTCPTGYKRDPSGRVFCIPE